MADGSGGIPPVMPRRPVLGSIASALRPLRHRMRQATEAIDRGRQDSQPDTARELVQVFDGGNLPTEADRVFVGYPTTIDADDEEGATPTFSQDTSQPIPVVVVRSPAVAGDLLVAHAVAGRWVAEIGVSGKATICVLACQDPSASNHQGATGLAGATVTLLLDGVAVGHCTTSSTGCCRIPISGGPKAYTIRISDAGGTTLHEFTRSIAPGGSAAVLLSCCALACVTICGGPPPPGCPVTVTVNAAGGSSIFSGQTDATGCVYLSLPQDDHNFSTYKAYLSGLPPRWVANPDGYPIGCADGLGQVGGGSQNQLSPTISPDVGSATCCGGVVIPLNLTLTDANGGHALAGANDGFGGVSWGCCYTMPLPDPSCACDPANAGLLAIGYTASCRPGSNPPIFDVTRRWAVTRQCDLTPGAPYRYAPSGCSGSNCNPDFLATDSSSGSATLDPCEAFSAAAALTPSVANHLADPVGGGVAIS